MWKYTFGFKSNDFKKCIKLLSSVIYEHCESVGLPATAASAIAVCSAISCYLVDYGNDAITLKLPTLRSMIITVGAGSVATSEAVNATQPKALITNEQLAVNMDQNRQKKRIN